MAMSNAERQRNYITRLKAAAISPDTAFSGFPTNMAGANDIVATMFTDWFEHQILRGQMRPATVDMIGRNLQFRARKYRAGFDQARARKPVSDESARRLGGGNKNRGD